LSVYYQKPSQMLMTSRCV